ncbi:MAG: winged helix-turn-helix domain-containing protein [Acidobacteria bacterium]|nr:winged helix-turn-helix domain-containing protein [Acidobacteriota bacterium]
MLLRNGDVVHLPPKAVDTLLVLLKSAGQPVEREALIHAVWPDTFVEENNLAHHVWVLRKTLGNGESGRAYIETIPKRGYRFLGEVKEAAEDAGDMPERAPVKPSGAVTRSRSTLALPALGALVAVWWLSHRGPSAPAFQSLAVLPFQNLSGDPNQNYVSDGLTEELICEMAKIGALRVISRTSVMRYKVDRKPLPQVSRELGAGAVVEGSIARFGDRLRVTVQLLDGAKDQHLWGETYEGDLDEIPKLWGEIAAPIAPEIRVQMQPQERARLAGRTVNREAFEAYLRGRYYWNTANSGSISSAFLAAAIASGRISVGGWPPISTVPSWL